MSSPADLVVVCADVGSVKGGKFAWWSSAGADGVLPSTLSAHLAELLTLGKPVALGFECPLFVPLAAEEQELLRQRPGENGRPWCASGGCMALVTGLVEVAWVLQDLKSRLLAVGKALPMTSTTWSDFAGTGPAEARLFLWEAFVSGASKKLSHVEDAETGARAFMASLPDPPASNAVACTTPVQSLLGAALLRTGWSTDIDELHRPCLVIRA